MPEKKKKEKTASEKTTDAYKEIEERSKRENKANPSRADRIRRNSKLR